MNWIGWLPALGMVLAAAQAPQPTDLDEVAGHVRSLQRRIDDPTVDMPTRERLAAEAAATYDRAARATANPEVRRKLWAEAVALLDRFRQAHPGATSVQQFEIQAAVYVWASGRSWVDPARADLADATSRARALADFDAAAGRLRPLVDRLTGSEEVIAQNARFRLAQTLADMADVGPADPATRRSRTQEALSALEKLPVETSLHGYALVLRASLLNGLSRFTEAAADLDAASALRPPPREAELVDVRVDNLIGQGKHPAARKLADSSRLAPAAKLALRVRVDLDDLRTRPAGSDRAAAEKSLFADLKSLRDARGPDARLALISAARTLREPSPGQEPVAWDLLADGALALGDAPRAAALERRGAERAEELGNARTAAELRLKSGAALFQAGKFVEADEPLTRVAEDPKAGDLRPRAALLRSVARGRSIAEKQAGASPRAYEASLRYQVEQLPNESTTNEARWLLGKLRAAESDLAGAKALWLAIPYGQPRWLDARVELADQLQRGIESRRATVDPEESRRQMDQAREFLDAALKEVRVEPERNTLNLARARLELVPSLGQPEAARSSAEGVLRSLSREGERDQARGLLMIALAQLSRFVEAEQIARQEAQTTPEDPAGRFELLQRIDRCAVGADTDLKTRRMGFLMSILLRPLMERAAKLSDTQRSELKLREVRSLLFTGEDVAARRALFGWSTNSLSSNPDLLADLANTYTRLEAYDLAASVHRLRIRSLPAGSPAWLEARYGLALSYFRTGKAGEAMSLIDATSILHPELGGGDLRNRFVRLRQRIQPNP